MSFPPSWPFLDVFLYYEDWVDLPPDRVKLHHLSPADITKLSRKRRTKDKTEEGSPSGDEEEEERRNGTHISLDGQLYSKWGFDVLRPVASVSLE